MQRCPPYCTLRYSLNKLVCAFLVNLFRRPNRDVNTSDKYKKMCIACMDTDIRLFGTKHIRDILGRSTGTLIQTHWLLFCCTKTAFSLSTRQANSTQLACVCMCLWYSVFILECLHEWSNYKAGKTAYGKSSVCGWVLYNQKALFRPFYFLQYI